MNYFYILALVAWLVYVYFVVKFCNKIVFKNLKFTEKLDPNIKEAHKPFERDDRKDWVIWEIYIGAIFLLPIRTVILVGNIFLNLLNVHYEIQRK